MPSEPGRKEVLDTRRRYGRMLAEAAGEMQKLREIGYTDDLTRLGNERRFAEEFPKIFEYAKANNLPLGVAYIDVRGLKRMNDKHKHAGGNKLLKAVGQAMLDTARDDDILIRIGGDEFVMIMPGYAPKEGQTQEGLDQETETRFGRSFAAAAIEHGVPEERHVGVDMGIASIQDHDTPESMVATADGIMQAKKDAYYAEVEQTQGINYKAEDRRTA